MIHLKICITIFFLIFLSNICKVYSNAFDAALSLIKGNSRNIEQSNKEIDRSLYSRQLLVYGKSAQLKLQEGHVLLICENDCGFHILYYSHR